jgi:cytoskeletal protein CcmA (bactofilin family)
MLHSGKNTTKAVWLALLTIISMLLAVNTGLAEEKKVRTKLLDEETIIKIQGDKPEKSPESYKFKVGDKEIEIDSKETQTGDVHVAAGDTLEKDLSTKGGTITVDGVVIGDCAVMGGSLIVNGQIDGDVACFGGNIEVPGRVTGSAACFGGTINVDGQVDDEIAAFGGNVNLGPKAQVGGDVSILGGKVEKSDSATIGGEVKTLELGMLNQFIPGMVGTAQMVNDHPVRGRLLSLGVWFSLALGMLVLVMLTTVFFPKQVEAVAKASLEDTWKSAGIGILIQVALAPALLLLIITIFGPLLLAMMFTAGLIMAMAAFGLIISQRWHHVVNKPEPSTVSAVLLGYGLLMSFLLAGNLINLAGSPFTVLGWILIIVNFIAVWCGTALGLGGVWLSRFGTVKTYRTQPAVPAVSAASPETKPQ